MLPNGQPSSIILVNRAVSSRGRRHWAGEAGGDKRLQCKEKGQIFALVKINKAKQVQIKNITTLRKVYLQALYEVCEADFLICYLAI